MLIPQEQAALEREVQQGVARYLNSEAGQRRIQALAEAVATQLRAQIDVPRAEVQRIERARSLQQSILTRLECLEKQPAAILYPRLPGDTTHTHNAEMGGLYKEILDCEAQIERCKQAGQDTTEFVKRRSAATMQLRMLESEQR